METHMSVNSQATSETVYDIGSCRSHQVLSVNHRRGACGVEIHGVPAPENDRQRPWCSYLCVTMMCINTWLGFVLQLQDDTQCGSIRFNSFHQQMLYHMAILFIHTLLLCALVTRRRFPSPLVATGPWIGHCTFFSLVQIPLFRDASGMVLDRVEQWWMEGQP